MQKRESEELGHRQRSALLLDVVRNVKPDILIGVSGQTGLFTEEIIREMHKHCERPIVMPPPTRPRVWKQRRRTSLLDRRERAGRNRQPVRSGGVEGQTILLPSATTPIFPGIGLCDVPPASRITDEMLMSASETWRATAAGERWRRTGAARAERHSQGVACYRVRGRKMAQQQGVAVKTSADALQQAIDDNFWMPEYRSYRRTSINTVFLLFFLPQGEGITFLPLAKPPFPLHSFHPLTH